MSNFGDAIAPSRGDEFSGNGSPLADCESPSSNARLVQCTNCGTEHVGDFCPACGQKVHLHNTLSAVGHDLVHGILHLDGKLWDTLKLLTTRPGELTRRYIAGERVRFVSPMSMFLFTVFAMFAVFQVVGITAPTDIVAQAALPEEMSQARSKIVERIAKIEEGIAQAKIAGDPAPSMSADLAEAKAELRAYDGARTIVLNEELGASVTFTKVGISIIDSAVEKWQKNPGLMIYKMQANAYKFSWLLIVLSIPFLSTLFLKNKTFNAYHHAVFVTYFFSFLSFIFVVCSLGSLLPGIGTRAFALLPIIAPIHLYLQLKQAYLLTHWAAIWRFSALLFSMLIVILAFVITLGLIGTF